MAVAIQRLHGKKGVFFSFLAIFILMALMLMFSFVFEPQADAIVQEAAHDQISLADSHLEFFRQSYLESVLTLSTRLALISYVQALHEEEDYIIDCFDGGGCGSDRDEIEQLETYLRNYIVAGNKDGLIDEDKEGIFASDRYRDLTLVEHLGSIRELYEEQFQIEITYLDSEGVPWPERWDGFINPDQDFIEKEILPKLHIEQDRAFSASVNYTLSFNVSIRGGDASWHYEDYVIDVDVPLAGLIDPLYMLGTMDEFGDDFQYNNTLYEDSKAHRDRDGLINLYTDMRYVAAPSLGPSYFQRLVNSDNPSDCCGIESFVNLNAILGRTIDQRYLSHDWFNRSNVDYLYFRYESDDPSTIFNCHESVDQDEKQLYYVSSFQSPPGNPNYFNLHTFYLEKYNISGKLTTGLCEFSSACRSDPACSPDAQEYAQE
ncbi:MAG: hypothetical protein ACOC32_01085 [Nanoarchaeota archaeon]